MFSIFNYSFLLSVAVFQFFESSISTSEDFSSISICLQLVEGLLATNITIELKQGTNDVMATSKIKFSVLIIFKSVYCAPEGTRLASYLCVLHNSSHK